MRRGPAIAAAIVAGLVVLSGIRTAGAQVFGVPAQLPARSFEVSTASADGKLRFRARIEVTPRLQARDGTLVIALSDREVKAHVLDETTCPGCVAINFAVFRSDWGRYPEQRRRRVRAEFDTGTVTAAGTDWKTELTVPPGATRLRRLEVVFGHGDFETTLTWGLDARAEPTWPWWLAAALAVAAAAALAVRYQRRRPRAVLELRLVRTDGAPLAGVRYRVVLPPGSAPPVRTGVLDASGRARLEGVRPGPCTVSFPDLAQDWQPEEIA